MINISVTSDVRRVTRFLSASQRRVVPRATRAALNKTATSTRTQAKRSIAEELNLKQKVVNKRLGLFRASNQRLIATISAPVRERPLNLIEWVRKAKRKIGAFRKAAGVSINIRKKTTIKDSFIGTAQGSGKLLVFRRKRKSRQPIEALSGPTISQAMRSKRVLAKMAEKAREVFPREFARALRRELAKISR